MHTRQKFKLLQKTHILCVVSDDAGQRQLSAKKQQFSGNKITYYSINSRHITVSSLRNKIQYMPILTLLSTTKWIFFH